MQQNRTKDIVIMGFALFAIFFGAGNLIFPPYLGIVAGENWWQAMIGFLLTDPVFPILGVIATCMVGGKADGIGRRISPAFAITLNTIAILTIGPFFAVPRTAATTHEVMTAQLFPGIPYAVTSGIFFAITLFFVLRPGKVVDYIGKFLTPGLLVILIGTIVICIFKPIGEIVPTEATGLFTTGVYEGYQTMDALGAPLTAGIVFTDIIRRGYTEHKDQFSVGFGVGIVAFVLLAIVYGGLTYVGATAGEYFTADTSRTEILVGVFYQMFGGAGKVAIGIAVALACLTTSVGLTSMAGSFLSGISKGKASYNMIAIICVIVSFALSLMGVDGLLFKAVPILSAIYPVIMLLIILTFFDKKIKYNLTYTGAAIGAFIISLPSALNLYSVMNFGAGIGALEGYMGMVGKLPLANFGFEWVLPAIAGGIVFTVIAMFTGGKVRANTLNGVD